MNLLKQKDSYTLRMGLWFQGLEECWGEGRLREFGMDKYTWLYSFTVHLKLSQHCLLISSAPIHIKGLKKLSESGKGRKPVKGVLSQRALRSVLWGNPGK